VGCVVAIADEVGVEEDDVDVVAVGDVVVSGVDWTRKE